MASPTDVRLVALVELVAQKSMCKLFYASDLMVNSIAQIYDTLSPLNGQVNHSTLAFIRRANDALDNWWSDCDEIHSMICPFVLLRGVN